MSDFFIGGLLVFSLLLPILLRPFFRGMHALGGIPVLAVPAVFLCAGLLVTGTRLLFFPLFSLWLLYHARKQGFHFSAGLRPGVDVLGVFTSPAYTVTVVFLLLYTVFLT